ncbi:hypothetical protein Scep_030660 [Stephania cephalantha]|uniref:Cation efflux protein cytoplasmic domain-containing protein n=1 Tax=Stephania cephalantha TaxID=152367 RepID=A0AAP0E7Q1_9MAGN
MVFRFKAINLIFKARISRISSSSSFNSFNSLFVPLNSISSPHKIPIRWHFGHSHHQYHHHHHNQDDLRSSKRGEHVFRLGLTADIGLATGKAITGYLTGSTAIIADAAHSISDVVLSTVALWSFKVGRAPKDKEHPYGHGKFETLGALGISCMLVATSGGIAWHALNILMELLATTPEIVNLSHGHIHDHSHGEHHHGIDMNHPILALNMTIVSIAVKEGLYRITKRAGEKEGSGLMKANAWHHRADAVSSVVALIGVGGSILGIKLLDPLAGLVVSGMILKAGIQNGYESVMELVDAGVPSHVLDPIKQTILQVEGVMGCHRLRGRRAGSSLYLDVHIEVDPFLSVSAAHDIGESVRGQIQKSHSEVAEVFIHIVSIFSSQVLTSKVVKRGLSEAMLLECIHTLKYKFIHILAEWSQCINGTRVCHFFLVYYPAVSKLPHNIPERQEHSEGMGCHKLNAFTEQKEIEALVDCVVSSKFSKKPSKNVCRAHYTSCVAGKLLLQIEVSMPPDMLIRDAIDLAKQAEEELLRAAASSVSQINIQLRLGQPMPQLGVSSALAHHLQVHNIKWIR